MSLDLIYVTGHEADEADRPLTKLSWSGGILTAPENASFRNIAGTFIVPNAYPPPKANDGAYRCFTCVGFDGTKSDHPAVLVGIKSQVVKTGKELHQKAVLFYQHNDQVKYFTSLKVHPGDLITAHLWKGVRIIFREPFHHRETFQPPHFQPRGPFPPRIRIEPVMRVFVVNHGSRHAFCHSFHIPKDFEGYTAEWLLSRVKPEVADSGDITVEALPNYGATFIHNTYALTTMKGVRAETVDDATLVNMVDPDPDRRIVSTATLPKSNVLLVYAYNDEESQ